MLPDDVDTSASLTRKKPSLSDVMSLLMDIPEEQTSQKKDMSTLQVMIVMLRKLKLLRHQVTFLRQ
jgi:hypothetical protein